MTEGIELASQKVIRMFREKETYKNLEILETDTIKQAKMKGKNTISGERGNYSKSNNIAENLIKRLNTCPHPFRILQIISKVNVRGTSINKPEKKKINDDP